MFVYMSLRARTVLKKTFLRTPWWAVPWMICAVYFYPQAQLV